MDEVSFIEWQKQGEGFEAYDYETLQKIYNYWYLLNPWSGVTHPFTVMQSLEMKRWIESGQYYRVLNRERVCTTGSVSSAICPRCGYWLSSNEKVCPICESLDGKTSHQELSTGCAHCGFVLDGTEQFCPNYGERLRYTHATR